MVQRKDRGQSIGLVDGGVETFGTIDASPNFTAADYLAERQGLIGDPYEDFAQSVAPANHPDGDVIDPEYDDVGNGPDRQDQCIRELIPAPHRFACFWRRRW